MKHIAIAAVLLAGFAAGCAETPESVPEPAPAVVVPPTVQAEDKGSVVQASNAFAFNLYANLRGQKGNLFFSPESLSTALSMAWCGARGETAGQMASVLGYRADRPITPEWIAKAYRGHLAELFSNPKGYELLAANALWGQKGYPFVPDYLALLKSNYGAGLEEADFRGDTEGARKTINVWVEKETRDKIKDLIPPGLLTGETRLVLTNAIYFKGTWAIPFKKDATADGDFFVAAGEKVQAPLMNQTGYFGYYDAGQWKALEMPYKGNELAMVILLPAQVDGLPQMEKDLAAGKVLGDLAANLKMRRIRVTVPRFKTTASILLGKTLAAMGMPLAFDPSKADFSGMNGGKESLCISEVVHKAFVGVNEEGTEAAAATAVVMTALEGMRMDEPPVFRADHPFIFLIRDKASGCILFLGRVVNPKE
jgi:serpin B